MKFGGFMVESMRPELFLLFCSSVGLYGEAIEFYPVSPAEFPYFAVVLSNGQAECGATLYTTSRLLTACHCLVKDSNVPIKSPHELEDAGKLEVAAGFDNTSDPLRPSGVSRKAKMVLVHPKCESNEKAMIYDYGMIEVAEPFELDGGYIEVRNLLAEKDVITQTINDPATFECITLDFKITPKKDDEKAWDLGALVKLFMGVHELATCKKELAEKNLDFDGMIQTCAKRMRDPPVECGQPDPAGVLVCREGAVLIGILSGRNRLYCGKEVSEVYSRVDVGVDWIMELEPKPSSEHPPSSKVPSTDSTTGGVDTDKTVTAGTFTPDPGPKPVPDDGGKPHSSSPAPYSIHLTSLSLIIIIQSIVN